jgi:hypothetical protein
MSEELFGVKEKEPEQKPIDFEFKTTKGSKVKISYRPSGSVVVSDKKAFEGHLKKISDSFEIVEKTATPKTLDVVAGESEEKDES